MMVTPVKVSAPLSDRGAAGESEVADCSRVGALQIADDTAKTGSGSVDAAGDGQCGGCTGGGIAQNHGTDPRATAGQGDDGGS